jgi:hypothetical protein
VLDAGCAAVLGMPGAVLALAPATGLVINGMDAVEGMDSDEALDMPGAELARGLVTESTGVVPDMGSADVLDMPGAELAAADGTGTTLGTAGSNGATDVLDLTTGYTGADACAPPPACSLPAVVLVASFLSHVQDFDALVGWTGSVALQGHTGTGTHTTGKCIMVVVGTQH